MKIQEFRLKDGSFSLSFLSVKGLVRSYQARLSDHQISVLSRKAGRGAGVPSWKQSKTNYNKQQGGSGGGQTVAKQTWKMVGLPRRKDKSVG